MSNRLVFFVLPFLLINIILSDGLAAMGLFPIGVLFFWTALILSLLAINTVFRNSKLTFFIAFGTFTFSILNLFFDHLFVSFLSTFFKSSVFCLVSAITVMAYPKMLNKQIRIFLVWTIPIMILQILGVSETVHLFNTLFYSYNEFGEAVLDLKLTNLLYVTNEKIIYNSSQARPPGLFHSNAILSPILLCIASFKLSYSTRNSLSYTDILLIFAIVLVMSKISVIGIFFILISTRHTNLKFRKIIFLLLLLYFLYWLLIPVFFRNNLSFDAFYISSYYRLIDIYISINDNAEMNNKYMDILSSELSYQYQDESDIGGLSGIASTLKFLPFLLALLFIFRNRIFKYYRDFKSFSPSLFIVSKSMLLTLIICNLAFPFFKAPMFGYFLGIALLPLIYQLSKNRFELLKNQFQSAYTPYN